MMNYSFYGDSVYSYRTDRFVTWGGSHIDVPNTTSGLAAAVSTLPLPGKPLGRLSADELTAVVEKGLHAYARENRELDVVLFREVLEHVARLDRVLATPGGLGGSLLLAGRSGVGRRLALTLVAHMHQMQLLTPKMGRAYGLKQFRNDLKAAMQLAGVELQQTVLLLEDHQLRLDAHFVEHVNDLLSSGEVVGLYSQEELEPLLNALREQAAEVGWRAPLAGFFAQRVRANLHVALVMDVGAAEFGAQCESNPALYKQCAVQWLEGWSRDSLLQIPRLLLLPRNASASPSKHHRKDKEKEKEKQLQQQKEKDPKSINLQVLVASQLPIEQLCKGAPSACTTSTINCFQVFMHEYVCIV